MNSPQYTWWKLGKGSPNLSFDHLCFIHQFLIHVGTSKHWYISPFISVNILHKPLQYMPNGDLKIRHTGNTWPSRTCLIEEYRYYTLPDDLTSFGYTNNRTFQTVDAEKLTTKVWKNNSCWHFWPAAYIKYFFFLI